VRAINGINRRLAIRRRCSKILERRPAVRGARRTLSAEFKSINAGADRWCPHSMNGAYSDRGLAFGNKTVARTVSTPREADEGIFMSKWQVQYLSDRFE
jgi:hypothetical protein